MRHYNNTALKKKLIESGHLINRCYKCNNEPYWNGSPLTLELDHIDGNSSNNELGNLRILCPNCHTQTDTYGGKRTRRPRIELICKLCKKSFSRTQCDEDRRQGRSDGPFCSKRCSNKHNGALGLKSRHGLTVVKRADPIKLICKQCNVQFLRQKNFEKFKSKNREEGPFCSGDCWNQYQSDRSK